MLHIHAGVYDPHAERRRQAEHERWIAAVSATRRLERWARFSARVTARLARRAAGRQLRPVACRELG